MTYKPSKEKPFVTVCKSCGGRVVLQKDQTEGMGVYCGKCSHQVTPK